VLTEKFPTILGANIAGPHINGQTYRDGEWTYDPEYVGTWEVGLKSDFLDGLGRTDLALFYTAITDNQFSIFTGTGFTVLNASTAYFNAPFHFDDSLGQYQGPPRTYGVTLRVNL